MAVQTANSVHHFRAIRATYTAPVQETLDVSNAVAAELAGISDGVLDALNERLHCHVRLRGNQLTLEGEDTQIAEASAVIDEIVELVEGGHQIGSHTVDAVLGTLEAGQDVREVFDAVVWRHRGKKIAPKTLTQKEYVDSIRRATVTSQGRMEPVARCNCPALRQARTSVSCTTSSAQCRSPATSRRTKARSGPACSS